jgi:hypothetical protein
MKKILLALLLLNAHCSKAQKIENVVVITTDGFRWQELFGGMDSAIANNTKFNQWDSAGIYKKYWDADAGVRRKKLLPFFWNVIATKGQVYGNRNFGNKVNVANPYWFSYPGYNEIFTGYPDTLVNSNQYKANPNTTLPEFLNHQPTLKNKVAAFGAWHAFERILNKQRSGIPVVNAFDTPLRGSSQLLAQMLQDSYRPFGDEECLDVFTHYQAMEYLQKKKPRFLYIGYGETDEWAHAGKYKDYLNAASQVDQWIEQLWKYIQSDPFYKNKTALFITTDHGRGDKIKEEWVTHGEGLVGADEIWFAVMGPGIKARGEFRNDVQLYQKQFAQTIAGLLGFTFQCEHRVADKINLNQ